MDMRLSALTTRVHFLTMISTLVSLSGMPTSCSYRTKPCENFRGRVSILLMILLSMLKEMHSSRQCNKNLFNNLPMCIQIHSKEYFCLSNDEASLRSHSCVGCHDKSTLLTERNFQSINAMDLKCTLLYSAESSLDTDI